MTEKRNSVRRLVKNTSVEVVDQESGVEFFGSVHTLSDEGLSFSSSLEPPVGADMRVALSGGSTLTGKMVVTRVVSGDARYEVAGRLV